MIPIKRTQLLAACAVALGVGVIATSANAQNTGSPQDVSLYPPNAKPGECYAKVLVPAQFNTVSEQVVKREAADKIEIVPAAYEWTEEKVLIKEATEEIKIIPATYKTVEEKIVVEPADKKLVTVEAVYATVTEKVLDEPARVEWKKGRGPIEKIDNSTGDIMCLVEIPASYKTVTKQVLKTPATTKVVDIPPVMKTVKKRVVDTPARVEKVKIPPVYSTIKVKKIVTPAQEKRIKVPAEYQTVSRKEKVSDEHMSWRSVLCETNMGPDIVQRIQSALKTKGYYSGEVDGVVGRGTMAAVERFQRESGMATGGLTMETLKALGVSVQT
jgi:hypothetical protein